MAWDDRTQGVDRPLISRQGSPIKIIKAYYLNSYKEKV